MTERDARFLPVRPKVLSRVGGLLRRTIRDEQDGNRGERCGYPWPALDSFPGRILFAFALQLLQQREAPFLQQAVLSLVSVCFWNCRQLPLEVLPLGI